MADWRKSTRIPMPTVMSIADQVAIDSEHAFDARRWRTDGRADPTGLVKGWALQMGAERLEAAGVRRSRSVRAETWSYGRTGHPWRIGIRHPDRDGLVAAVLRVRDGSVATSATYERGPHIRDPRTGRAVGDARSVTVVGPDLALPTRMRRRHSFRGLRVSHGSASALASGLCDHAGRSMSVDDRHGPLPVIDDRIPGVSHRLRRSQIRSQPPSSTSSARTPSATLWSRHGADQWPYRRSVCSPVRIGCPELPGGLDG